jgi:anti-sigma B factor antagonist
MGTNFYLDTKKETLPGGTEVIIGHVGGAIDSATNAEFDSRMKELLNEGTGNLILVLADVKYINSTGMGALIKFADSFRALGGDIKLVAVPRKVEALFEMLGLLSLFKTFQSEEEALTFLSDTEAPVETEEVEPAEDGGIAYDRSLEPDHYPVHFSCPSCATRVEINKSGQYKCPKCSTFYSAGEDGSVRALRLEESRLLDLKIPSNLKFTEGLKHMVTTYAREFQYPQKVLEDINRAIDESWALVVGKAEKESDLCHVFMVGNTQELITGILVTGEAFTQEPGGTTTRTFKIINSSMDSVEVSSLPSGGQLLKMVKKI